MQVFVSIGIAAVLAFFVFLATHWGSRELFGDLGKLASYIVGTALITAIYLGWCLFQHTPIPALIGWAAYAAITVGAGLGTLAGHFVDNHTGLYRQVQVYQRRVGDDE